MQPVSLVVKKEYGSSETATWQVDGLIVGRLDVDWKLVTKESGSIGICWVQRW